MLRVMWRTITIVKRSPVRVPDVWRRWMQNGFWRHKSSGPRKLVERGATSMFSWVGSSGTIRRRFSDLERARPNFRVVSYTMCTPSQIICAASD